MRNFNLFLVFLLSTAYTYAAKTSTTENYLPEIAEAEDHSGDVTTPEALEYAPQCSMPPTFTFKLKKESNVPKLGSMDAAELIGDVNSPAAQAYYQKMSQKHDVRVVYRVYKNSELLLKQKGDGLGFKDEGEEIKFIIMTVEKKNSRGQFEVISWDAVPTRMGSPQEDGGFYSQEGVFNISEIEMWDRSNKYGIGENPDGEGASMPLSQRLSDDGMKIHWGYVNGSTGSHGCFSVPGRGVEVEPSEYDKAYQFFETTRHYCTSNRDSYSRLLSQKEKIIPTNGNASALVYPESFSGFGDEGIKNFPSKKEILSRIRHPVPNSQIKGAIPLNRGNRAPVEAIAPYLNFDN